MNLRTKYRPNSWKTVLGNDEIISTIPKLLSGETPSHTFLLHGPTGCGKTTIARIIANEVNAKGNDIKELNAADNRGIDTAREINRNSEYQPMHGDSIVWIIDEAHKLTSDAQNALLKILEEPPSHVYFILCTTEPNKLLNTVRGRCSQFQVKPLSDLEMKRLLIRVTKKEGKKISKTVSKQIINDSLGLPRNALEVLEQVIAVPLEKQAEIAKRKVEEVNQSIELCRILIKNTGWVAVRKILNGLKNQEPEAIRRHVLGYCQAVVLNGDNPRAGLVMEEFIEPFYDTGFPELVLACYKIVKS